MGDVPEGRLEAAVADLGTLLVQVGKYRRGTRPEATALHRAALALGDEARRLHRHDRLDPEAARPLLAEAERLRDRLHALVAAIRSAPQYRAAVAAHARGDRAALAAALPAIFASLEVVPCPPDLFHPITWLRRGRPRPAAEVAADVARARTEGLTADGDDLTPGVDPALPAVVLSAEPPPGDPVVLRLAAAGAPAPVCRLTDTGDYLIHVERLRAPFTVLLAATLAEDELEETPVDYPGYRRELAAALAGLGLVVENL